MVIALQRLDELGGLTDDTQIPAYGSHALYGLRTALYVAEGDRETGTRADIDFPRLRPFVVTPQNAVADRNGTRGAVERPATAKAGQVSGKSTVMNGRAAGRGIYRTTAASHISNEPAIGNGRIAAGREDPPPPNSAVLLVIKQRRMVNPLLSP